MSVKLIVFDMAGTTVEDHQNVAQALKNAMGAFGYQVTIDDANRVMGYPKPVAITSLLEQYHISDAELVQQIHQQFVKEMILYYEKSELISEKSDAANVFAQLREMGINVAIDTGFSRDIADTIFKRLGWKKGVHFDVSVTSDEVAHGRPYPDMIFRAMELLGISSVEQVAKVGDTISDLLEGNAAGCKYVIGITTGAYTAEGLKAVQHTHLITELEEIIDIVSSSEELIPA